MQHFLTFLRRRTKLIDDNDSSLRSGRKEQDWSRDNPRKRGAGFLLFVGLTSTNKLGLLFWSQATFVFVKSYFEVNGRRNGLIRKKSIILFQVRAKDGKKEKNLNSKMIILSCVLDTWNKPSSGSLSATYSVCKLGNVTYIPYSLVPIL